MKRTDPLAQLLPQPLSLYRWSEAFVGISCGSVEPFFFFACFTEGRQVSEADLFPLPDFLFALWQPLRCCGDLLVLEHSPEPKKSPRVWAMTMIANGTSLA